MKEYCRGAVMLSEGEVYKLEFVYIDDEFYAWCSCDKCSKRGQVCKHIKQMISEREDLKPYYEAAGEIKIGRP